MDANQNERHLQSRCLGMLEAVGEVFPDVKYHRCTVPFYHNVFSVTPRSKGKLVAKMLWAIQAQESKRAAREKAAAEVGALHCMKLKGVAQKVEDGIEEALTYCEFPSEHRTRIRTNVSVKQMGGYQKSATYEIISPLRTVTRRESRCVSYIQRSSVTPSHRQCQGMRVSHRGRR